MACIRRRPYWCAAWRPKPREFLDFVEHGGVKRRQLSGDGNCSVRFGFEATVAAAQQGVAELCKDPQRVFITNLRPDVGAVSRDGNPGGVSLRCQLALNTEILGCTSCWSRLRESSGEPLPTLHAKSSRPAPAKRTRGTSLMHRGDGTPGGPMGDGRGRRWCRGEGATPTGYGFIVATMRLRNRNQSIQTSDEPRQVLDLIGRPCRT